MELLNLIAIDGISPKKYFSEKLMPHFFHDESNQYPPPSFQKIWHPLALKLEHAEARCHLCLYQFSIS